MNEELACEMIKKIAQCWETELVSRRFVLVFGTAKYEFAEVVVIRHHLLHLTGAITPLSADDFYKRALKGSLRPTDFTISEQHYKSKLIHLFHAPNFLIHSSKIGWSRNNRMYLQFSFAVGPFPCVAFETEKPNGVGIPKSLLQIHLAKMARDIQDIKAIYAKHISSSSPYKEKDCILKRQGFDPSLLDKTIFG